MRSKVRVFKFDGIGSGLRTTGAGKYSQDVDRLLELSRELREDAASTDSRSTWISITTGSWPSPFFLDAANAVWRGGPDLGRQGDGSPRQQWITFRDTMVHSWVVQRAPLFPLSGLSLGGIVWSGVEEPGAYLSSYAFEEFQAEVRSFFLTGAAVQDLLIQPALLKDAHWDVLADAVNVSRQHGGVLRDAHWAGGDPAVGEVYGYAAYGCSPCRGVLSWRNPKQTSQNLTFTLRSALALPRAWPGGAAGGLWAVTPLWPQPASSTSAAAAGAPALQPEFNSVSLDSELRRELAPFELWAVEAVPLLPGSAAKDARSMAGALAG